MKSLFYTKVYSGKLIVSLLLFLCLFMFTLSCSQKSDSILTYTVSDEDFTVTITVEGILEAKNNRVISAPQTLGNQSTLSYIVPEGSIVRKDDIVAEFTNTQLETELSNAKNEVEIATAEALQKKTEAKVQRLLLESQLKSADANLALEKQKLANLEFIAPTRREISKLNIKKTEIETEKTKRKLASLENIQKEEQNYMQLKIKQAEIKLNNYQRLMGLLTIKSPQDGIIIYEMNWSTDNKYQIGDVVYRGRPFMKIPDLSVMQINLSIDEIDAQKIKKDQKAVVNVSSADVFQIPGKVTRIDKIAKPVKRGSKVKEVGVIVELDTTQAAILPGLTAECIIDIERIEKAVMIPQECLFEKDSTKIVYILENNKFVARSVEPVYNSSNYIAVKNGLSGGEKLALREPGSKFIKKDEN